MLCLHVARRAVGRLTRRRWLGQQGRGLAADQGATVGLRGGREQLAGSAGVVAGAGGPAAHRALKNGITAMRRDAGGPRCSLHRTRSGDRGPTLDRSRTGCEQRAGECGPEGRPLRPMGSRGRRKEGLDRSFAGS